jgi:glycosyltransferase involved in cell wall biosynthesis
LKVAVVTPYHAEPRPWIERCIASVAAQTHACEHIVVADGRPQDWIDAAGVRHLRLDRAHADYGNTPRALGGLMAISEGFDAIAFLDADNRYEPGHVASCVAAAHATGADYVTTLRTFVREDGSPMPYEWREDLTGAHVDTSCFFLLFGAFHAVPRWLLMPKPMTIFGDRFFLKSLRDEGLREARTGSRTVDYLCTWADVYRAVGEMPPAFAKQGLPIERLDAWMRRLKPGDLHHVRRLAGCSLQPVS